MFTFQLHRMREVKVGLSKPWCATRVWGSQRHSTRSGILSDVSPLAAAKNARGFDGFTAACQSNIGKRGERSAFVRRLKETKGGVSALPRQLIVNVTFERIGAICRQGAIVRLSVRA